MNSNFNIEYLKQSLKSFSDLLERDKITMAESPAKQNKNNRVANGNQSFFEDKTNAYKEKENISEYPSKRSKAIRSAHRP
jgi:hypothetical protein